MSPEEVGFFFFLKFSVAICSRLLLIGQVGKFKFSGSWGRSLANRVVLHGSSESNVL